MSQAGDSARGRMQQANAEQRAAALWTPPRKLLLADSFIGAPARLSRQPDLCLPHRWLITVDDLTKLVYGQRTQVEIETARFLNENRAYLVREMFCEFFK